MMDGKWGTGIGVVLLTLLYCLPGGSTSNKSEDTDLHPCTFRGYLINNLETVRLDPCTECLCYNGTVKCSIEKCQTLVGCSTRDIIVIPEECCPRCRDIPDNHLHSCSFRGNVLTNNESIQLDKCTECVCYKGTVECSPEECPSEVGCSSDDLIVVPEECCPQCRDTYLHPCSFRGSLLNTHQSIRLDPCTQCFCYNGTVLCNIKRCPTVVGCRSKEDIIDIPGECCPQCRPNTYLPPCSFRGSVLNTHQSIRLDPCTECICYNGTVKCSIEECPAEVGCRSIDDVIIMPEYCCPQCRPNTHLRTCSFRGNVLISHQSIMLDPCTECVCYDGTVTCSIERCPEVECSHRDIILIPEECCLQCPYNVFIKDTTTNLYDDYSLTVDVNTTLQFSLDIAVDKEMTSRIIKGENLWKLSVWISSSADGSGRKYEYKNNIFNEEDTSKEYSRLLYPPWVWSNLTYNLTFNGGSCADYQYFCARFEKADNPRPTYNIPFVFQPVNNEKEKLIGCVPLGECNDRPPVLTINPNGTIITGLPSYVPQEITDYTIEYREANTSNWISREYFGNLPKILPGHFEEGVTYEMRITLNGGDGYRSPDVTEIFTMPCRDIDINLELSVSSRRGRARIKTDWTYPNRRGECSVTNQMISVRQIDLDNCIDPTNPLNETTILRDNERHYKRGKLRANTEYNVTLTVEDQHKRHITWKLIRTPEKVPTSPPDGISSSSNRTVGRLLIRWNPLPCGKRNSRILSYVVRLKNNRGTNVRNFNDTEAEYIGFEIGERYSFRVAAKNSRGIGPFSPNFGGRFGVN